MSSQPLISKAPSPFELTEDDIRLMAGELTPDEMLAVKAVVNGIKSKFIHTHNNGMTHADGCWAWGPTHYACAYETIVAMQRSKPAMTWQEVNQLSGELGVHFEDVEDIVRAVEAHHNIGGVR